MRLRLAFLVGVVVVVVVVAAPVLELVGNVAVAAREKWEKGGVET